MWFKTLRREQMRQEFSIVCPRMSRVTAGDMTSDGINVLLHATWLQTEPVASSYMCYMGQWISSIVTFSCDYMRNFLLYQRFLVSVREQYMALGSRPQYRVLIEKDVPMQTRDGVTLRRTSIAQSARMLPCSALPLAV